jgi:cytidylate kinase
MNIILSGWPGTGTTTLALLLANLLDYKYLYAGGLLKYIAKRSVGVESGAKFVEFENTVGPYWDMLWEKYAVWKLRTLITYY